MAAGKAMTLDFSRCREVKLIDGTMSPTPEHVKVGAAAIVQHPFFLLADDMGGMKTAQTIIAAQFLSEMKKINRVIVVCPASVRSVWYDKELGQLNEQLWFGKKSKVTLYHERQKAWIWEPTGDNELRWVITNYEFIRRPERLQVLFPYANAGTMLVLDESSAVKGYDSQQTKACMELRKRCGRVLLLNGTPVANSPLDMFAQGNMMHESVLECKYITHFKMRYAVMEPVTGRSGNPLLHRGRPIQHIAGWRDLEDLQRRFAPYVLRREAKDLGINFALPPVAMTVPLTKPTWKVYKEMREQMLAELKSGNLAVVNTAAVKSMRLAQITSGFVGGVRLQAMPNTPVQPGLLESLDLGMSAGVMPFAADAPPILNWRPCPVCNGDLDQPRDRIRLDENLPCSCPQPEPVEYFTDVEFIGREKLDFALEWQETLLQRYPDLKLLTWCRFVPELSRYLHEVQAKFGHPVGAVAGQSILGDRVKDEREKALRLLHPKTAPAGPATVGGTYGTGSLGLNFTACRTVLDISYDFSPWKKSQGDARVNRPGQTGPVSFHYLMAVGPEGQKTIDYHIIMARLGKQDINNWTAAAWIHALEEE